MNAVPFKPMAFPRWIPIHERGERCSHIRLASYMNDAPGKPYCKKHGGLIALAKLAGPEPTPPDLNEVTP